VGFFEVEARDFEIGEVAHRRREKDLGDSVGVGKSFEGEAKEFDIGVVAHRHKKTHLGEVLEEVSKCEEEKVGAHRHRENDLDENQLGRIAHPCSMAHRACRLPSRS